MRNLTWTVTGILLVLLAAVYIDLPNTHDFFGRTVNVNKGIDLAGGARLLLCADKQQNVSSSNMDVARNVIESRAAGGIGVTEPQVTRVGNDCIAVEMPGLKNQSEIIRQIGKTGFLALTDSGATNLAPQTKVKLVCKTAGCAPKTTVGATNATANPPVLQIVAAGKYVQSGSAQVGFDSNNQPQVTYTLQGAGNDSWCNYTTGHVGSYSAIVLDGKVVSDPTIQGAICGGQTVITGLTSTTEAQSIATYLNYGALPVALHIDSSQQVAASLGPQYVDAATKAAIIGLIIVAIFMLLYYRLPGLLADIALIMYATIVFAAFKLFGVTLTLAGIAGFVLSIGMAVDANVLIFERMREELRSGKTLGASVDAGFRRAWPSIRDSNASTLITTVILFWFGHNFAATVITGFATTLFLGVIISLLTAVFVSQTLLQLLVRSGYARNPNLFGVENLTGGRVA